MRGPLAFAILSAVLLAGSGLGLSQLAVPAAPSAPRAAPLPENFGAVELADAARTLAALASPPTWTHLHPAAAPPGVNGAALAYDAQDHYVVLFGGRLSFVVQGSRIAQFSNETWTYANGTWTNRSASTPSPCARWEAAFAYDAASRRMLLFGGEGRSACGGVLNDTWAFGAGRWSELRPPNVPPRRSGASFAYDPAVHAPVLFGGLVGFHGSQHLANDTWEFLHGSWHRWNVSGAPSPRFRAAMAYYEPGQFLLLFGGSGPVGLLNDTWRFAGARWTLGAPTQSPPARAGGAMVYDRTLGEVILFAGYTNLANLNDTWTYRAGLWSAVCASCAPQGRWGAAMTFDANDGYALMFGGSGCPKEVGSMCHATWKVQ